MIISITCPPRQLRTWEYYRQNRMIKLDFMRCQRQVLECFWKSDQKSTLIAGFRTHNECGTSRGSKLVHIGDLHMGLISRLQRREPSFFLMKNTGAPIGDFNRRICLLAKFSLRNASSSFCSAGERGNILPLGSLASG